VKGGEGGYGDQVKGKEMLEGKKGEKEAGNGVGTVSLNET